MKRHWSPLTTVVLVCAMALVVGVTVRAPGHAAHAATSDWSMFLGNDARTGYNGSEAAITPTTASNLQVQWTFPTGGRINAQPIVADGQVYVGSWDGKEYATDLSGKQLWTASIGGQAANCSSPAVFGIGSTSSVADVMINQTSTLVVFVGGKDPTSNAASLYALNTADGTTI